jgi:hypothetical protein
VAGLVIVNLLTVNINGDRATAVYCVDAEEGGRAASVVMISYILLIEGDVKGRILISIDRALNNAL